MIRFLGLFSFALCASVLAEEKKNTKYKFSFGAIADCQYCEVPDRGQRNMLRPRKSYISAWSILTRKIYLL